MRPYHRNEKRVDGLLKESLQIRRQYVEQYSEHNATRSELILPLNIHINLMVIVYCPI